MASLAGFDASTVDPMTEFEPIPAGDYLAQIVESEDRPTKAGTGEYLNLTFEIMEGDYQGRRVWARLNLKNPNPTAVRLAIAELAAICRAIDVIRPSESAELHLLPMIISVKVKKRSDTGELANEIKNYAAKSNRIAAQVRPVSTNGTAPWKRG